jgi:hypothetical protein
MWIGARVVVVVLAAAPAARGQAPNTGGPTPETPMVTVPAAASEAPQGASAAPVSANTARTCAPECRSGFTCVAGACVSACNPPCPANQQCVENGRCVAPDRTELKQAVRQVLNELYEEERLKRQARTVRRHDGFYARFGFNAGYAWDTAERGEIETTSKGAGGFLEWAVGDNVSHHVVFGFAFHTFGVFSPTTKVAGQPFDADHTALYTILGTFIDYYPDPTAGWHAMLTLGLSDADIQIREDESSALGIGVLLGGGYDFWIGEQWSLGVAARLGYISGASDDFGEHRVIIPMLAFTALYH